MESTKEILDRLRIEKRPAIEKILFPYFEKKGLTFEPWDGHLENVVISGNGHVCKIAHEMFYRLSGRCVMLKSMDKKGKKKKKEENYIDVVYMDDESFYDWLKMSILLTLKIETV